MLASQRTLFQTVEELSNCSHSKFKFEKTWFHWVLAASLSRELNRNLSTSELTESNMPETAGEDMRANNPNITFPL